MRPLKLRVAGLRSYRSERTLDFTDRSLMAILGDTGSGKSSLLEALYGALYGASTWDARGLGALLADGVRTLQIELEFSARGKRYTVSRSTSRDNYPPSKHVLKGEDGEHVDGERNVSRRIVQIVGLTDQEFLRVVILPQGRFGQLLQGTAGERTPILRGILGLGVLDRVREIADRQSGDLAEALEPLTAARARLYPDPIAVAAQAQKAVAEHKARHGKLDATARAIAAVEASSSAVEQVLPAVTTALTHAQALDLTAALNASAKADVAADELDAEVLKLRTERLTHEADDTDLSAKIASATAEGFTPESIALAGAALDQLVDALPAMHRDALELAKANVALRTRETTLTTDELTAAAAKVRADLAKVELARLEADVNGAADTVREARGQLTTLGSLLATLEARGAALQVATREVLAAAIALRTAQAQLAQTHDDRDTTRAAHQALLAGNRAAHVASGHRPGDPCPVCSRDLPADFCPAVIVGEDDLQAALAAAEEAFTRATADERIAERLLDKRRQQLLTDLSSLADTASQAVKLDSLAGWSGKPSGGRAKTGKSSKAGASAEALVQKAVDQLTTSTDVDAAAINAVAVVLAERLREYACAPAAAVTVFGSDSHQAQALLEPLLAKETAARQAVTQAKARADELATETASLAATIVAATSQLEQDKQAHQVNTDRTAHAAARLAKQVRALPAVLAEPLSTALNLTAPNPAQALLAAPPIPAATVTVLRTTLSDRAYQLDGWKKERDGARADIADIDRRLAERVDARRTLVDVPRSRARTYLERVAGVIRALTGSLPALDLAWERLTAAAPPLLPLPARGPELADDISSDCSDAELTAVSRAMATRLAEACSTLAAIDNAAAAGLKQARGGVATTLNSADVPSVAALMAELADATHLLHEAQVRLDRSRAQEPIAAGMDEGLSALKDRLALLRAIKDVMSPSLFPSFVVTQRQTALLRIASSLMAHLTREAYGFGDEFMIVDRRTGQPRHAKTLSGGETFLASLALALALVEISNRSGGQLDALFLDEGFGSLDASFLGEALDLLREQSTGGRLVGVISHLHAVAAELDDVLLVTKDIEGSDFRWLDAEERDRFLLDDVTAGLLA